ncbi:MAG: hypothetical protein KGH58_03910 [Candidatus Micrarchaeota archaeon]|nr:hypothetical protein [Candidatus Micrarchaeota archaeon]
MARRRAGRGGKGLNTMPLYAILFILFALYIFYQGTPSFSTILGIALFAVIVILIALEVINGFREEGYKKNVIELGLAIAIVLVAWFVLKFALNTANPVDVVPSCSMLPVLNRGDMVVIQGVTNPSALKAPIINVTAQQYRSFISNLTGEQLQCVAYKQTGNNVVVSQLVPQGFQVGLYKGSSLLGGAQIVPPSGQAGNMVQYSCGIADIKYSNGTTAQEAVTTGITVNGRQVSGDPNNSVVVYQTVPRDYFYQLGDNYIVHRVYAVINASGTYYALTKGDNNPGLDLQYGNYPAELRYVQGKVIADIPYLGYLRLILSSNFNQPAGCNSVVQK